MNSIAPLAGCLMLIAICAWTVAHLFRKLRSSIQTGTAIDRTLSEVDKDDAPTLYWGQLFGLAFLMVLAALIGIWMTIVLIQGLLW